MDKTTLHPGAVVAIGFLILPWCVVRWRVFSPSTNFSRRSESADPLANLAKSLGPQQFARRVIDRHPHFSASAQVNIFANNGFYGRPVSDEDLRRACARFGSFSLCAPVERYDEAMVALEYFNSPVFAPAGLDLAYVRQNVGGTLEGEDDLRELFGERKLRLAGSGQRAG